MFHLFIVTPEKIVFDDKVVSVTIPGSNGYFQILKNNMPLISSVTTGKLTLIDANQNKTIWAISGGIFEVTHNQATLLGDAIELAETIDFKRAELALKSAKKVLGSSHDNEELMNAKNASIRAKNRIKIAGQGRSKK